MNYRFVGSKAEQQRRRSEFPFISGISNSPRHVPQPLHTLSNSLLIIDRPENSRAIHVGHNRHRERSSSGKG